jgi:hypothetical protein
MVLMISNTVAALNRDGFITPQSICDPFGMTFTAFRVLSLPSVLCKYLKLRLSADSIPSAREARLHKRVCVQSWRGRE